MCSHIKHEIDLYTDSGISVTTGGRLMDRIAYLQKSVLFSMFWFMVDLLFYGMFSAQGQIFLRTKCLLNVWSLTAKLYVKY